MKQIIRKHTKLDFSGEINDNDMWFKYYINNRGQYHGLYITLLS